MDYKPSYSDQLYDDLYLAHHGVLGQKWGVRRYQNSDGTLTSAGKARKKGIIKRVKDKWNSLSDTQQSAIIAAGCIIGYSALSAAITASTIKQSKQRFNNNKYGHRKTAQQGKKAADRVMNDFGKVKYSPADVSKAKERLNRAMKNAAKQEANGGMNVDALNEVKAARDAYRRMKKQMG